MVKTEFDTRGPMLITASFSALLAIWLWSEDKAPDQAQNAAPMQTAAMQADGCAQPGADCAFSAPANEVVTRAETGRTPLNGVQE